MAGDRLRRILEALSDGEGGWSPDRLCGACPEIVGVNGAGVMLMSGDIPRGSLCTTDEVSHLIEDLQYTLGEGPCVDAYRRDQVVAEPDWPTGEAPVAGLHPPALRAGARAVSGFRYGPGRCAWGRSTCTGTGLAR